MVPDSDNMERFLYRDSPFPVRQDIVDVNRRTWERISRAGSWWTAAERVAIAAEVRNAHSCTSCRVRKQGLTPTAVEDRHGSGEGLPEAAVDAVHRIVTDHSRLSEDWVRGLARAGISDGHYEVPFAGRGGEFVDLTQLGRLATTSLVLCLCQRVARETV